LFTDLTFIIFSGLISDPSTRPLDLHSKKFSGFDFVWVEKEPSSAANKAIGVFQSTSEQGLRDQIKENNQIESYLW